MHGPGRAIHAEGHLAGRSPVVVAAVLLGCPLGSDVGELVPQEVYSRGGGDSDGGGDI